jgi:hypothetical protein
MCRGQFIGKHLRPIGIDDIIDRHLRAFGGEHSRNSTPQPGGAASDKNNLIFQV